MRPVIDKFWLLVWGGIAGYLALYGYGLVTGVFSPAELAGFTAIAVVAAVGFAVHALHVRRHLQAPRDPDDPDELSDDMHRARERRGF